MPLSGHCWCYLITPTTLTPPLRYRATSTKMPVPIVVPISSAQERVNPSCTNCGTTIIEMTAKNVPEYFSNIGMVLRYE